MRGKSAAGAFEDAADSSRKRQKVNALVQRTNIAFVTPQSNASLSRLQRFSSHDFLQVEGTSTSIMNATIHDQVRYVTYGKYHKVRSALYGMLAVTSNS